MSGIFNYKPYRLVGLKEQIEDKIEGGKYSEQTLGRFREAIKYLNKTHTYLNRISKLVNNEDNEVWFHVYLDTELNSGRTISLRQIKEAYNLPHEVVIVIGDILRGTVKESYLGLERVIGEAKELPDDYDYINPAHYKKGGVEVIDIIEQYNLSYCAGNVVKYLLRYQYKGSPKLDLEKAIWYLKKEHESNKRKFNWVSSYVRRNWAWL